MDAQGNTGVRWRSPARAAGAAPAARARPPLDQILDNLIENAISYAPGRISLGAALDGGIIRLSVSDEGPGIAADEVERVTERFYRGRGTTAGGTGLGLAIVRDLAERWGGTVEVNNRPGSGTRVEVLLPPA